MKERPAWAEQGPLRRSCSHRTARARAAGRPWGSPAGPPAACRKGWWQGKTGRARAAEGFGGPPAVAWASRAPPRQAGQLVASRRSCRNRSSRSCRQSPTLRRYCCSCYHCSRHSWCGRSRFRRTVVVPAPRAGRRSCCIAGRRSCCCCSQPLGCTNCCSPGLRVVAVVLPLRRSYWGRCPGSHAARRTTSRLKEQLVRTLTVQWQKERSL